MGLSKKDEKIIYLFIRYLVLLLLMFSLPILYFILTPSTIYPVAGLLTLFYSVSVKGAFITLNNCSIIQIIPSCVAGSAYLLLLILNLFTPMNYKKRIYSIIFSFALLLILNMIRVFILAIFNASYFELFDLTHKLFWYLLSTIFVVLIWILTVKIFKIKEIPVYSDIKYLAKDIKKPRK